jgi:hypothetical protein
MALLALGGPGFEIQSDDDDQEDNKHFLAQMEAQLNQIQSVSLGNLGEYINKPKYQRGRNDPETNVHNAETHKCYAFPGDSLQKTMCIMERCRREGIPMCYYERQGVMSGIMDDFDIKQKSPNSKLNDFLFLNYAKSKCELLAEVLQFPPNKTSIEIIIGITRKPRLRQDKTKTFWKDGFHALIPGVMVDKATKKFLISKLSSQIPDMFSGIDIIEGQMDKVYDVNSATVPTLFVGHQKNALSESYQLHRIIRVKLDLMSGRASPVIDSELLKDYNVKTTSYKYKVNYTSEFSLNLAGSSFTGAPRLIVKNEYKVKDEFSKFLIRREDVVPSNMMSEEDEDYGKVSLLRTHDPDVPILKKLLDAMDPKRSNDFVFWRQVCSALANISPSYKPLARYFSKKSPKYCPEEFDGHWEGFLKSKNSIGVATIHYFAREDSPQSYSTICKSGIESSVRTMITRPISKGYLGHNDIARILHILLGHKYAYDYSSASWYEFIIEGDKCEPGQIWKWVEYTKNTHLHTMGTYISTTLPMLFENLLKAITARRRIAETDEKQKFWYTVEKNFGVSTRNLQNFPFKRAVIKEAEEVFNCVGFTRSLNKNPYILGVGNGLLDLTSGIPKLIGYSNHRVSRFTETNYVEFNPYDPNQKKVLISMRNLFADSEPDSHHYYMCLKAKCLDGVPPPPTMAILWGAGENGKTLATECFKNMLGSQFARKLAMNYILHSKYTGKSEIDASLLSLIGAHLAYFSESNEHSVLDLAKIKEMTGGDTLSCRTLYDAIIQQFRLCAIFLAVTNNLFVIKGTDHGTWRRIRLILMKIKFVSQMCDYDPDNPFIRMADPELTKKWQSDPETMSAFLAVYSYYYTKLRLNHGGDIRKIPTPHIDMDTEKYRNGQDTINNFLCSLLVRPKTSEEMKAYMKLKNLTQSDIDNLESECQDIPDSDEECDSSDDDEDFEENDSDEIKQNRNAIKLAKEKRDRYKQPLPEIVLIYMDWYKKSYPAASGYEFKHVTENIKNSKISKKLVPGRVSTYLKEMRILNVNEQPRYDEVYESEIKNLAPADIPEPENAEQYYARICAEYDIKKSQSPSEAKSKNICTFKPFQLKKEEDDDEDPNTEFMNAITLTKSESKYRKKNAFSRFEKSSRGKSSYSDAKNPPEYNSDIDEDSDGEGSDELDNSDGSDNDSDVSDNDSDGSDSECVEEVNDVDLMISDYSESESESE